MISCSSAVWECHGTTHPGGAFRIHVDGPVKGSPVSSADARHVTSRSGANGTDPKGFTVPVIASSARTPPPVRHPTVAAAKKNLFIGVFSCLLGRLNPSDAGAGQAAREEECAADAAPTRSLLTASNRHFRRE